MNAPKSSGWGREKPKPIENNLIQVMAAPPGLRAYFKIERLESQPVVALAIIEEIDEEEQIKVRELCAMVCCGAAGLTDASSMEGYLGVAVDEKDAERFSETFVYSNGVNEHEEAIVE